MFFLNDFKSVTFKDLNLKKNIPEDLKGNLFIGIVDDTSGLRQFEGKVANLVLIDAKEDIHAMVKNLCDSHSLDGKTILSWNFTGNVEQYNSQSWEVCNQNKTYIVANGAAMRFEDAFRTCSRIWSGVMTLPNSRQHLNSLMFVFKGGHCKRVWIPISDEEVEGNFKSVEDGKLVSYLPWLPSEPNEGKEGNNVFYDLVELGYNDKNGMQLHCFYCEVPIDAQFLLSGLCEYTYFGKDY